MPGVALWQLAGVLSCLDGEVARRTTGPTAFGDFIDNAVDRFVEVLILGAVTLHLSRIVSPDDRALAVAAGGGLIAVSGLIVNSAEKFRAAFGSAYPKRRLEPGFIWVSAGLDGRANVVSLGLLGASITGRPGVLLAVVLGLAVVGLGNYGTRLLRIVRRADRLGSGPDVVRAIVGER